MRIPSWLISEDDITCPHWLFPIHTENGSTACECVDSVNGAVKKLFYVTH